MPSSRIITGLKWGGACFLAGILALGIVFLRLKWETLGPSVLLQVVPSGTPTDAREALVVTGTPGTGCFVYLVHEPDHHARIGYDAWGAGGPTSEAFDFPAAKETEIGLELPGADPEVVRLGPPEGRLRITVDGRVVMDRLVAWHPARDGQIYFGRNPIGGTACWASFSGTMREGSHWLWGTPPPDAPPGERLRRSFLNRAGGPLGVATILAIAASLVASALLLRQRWAMKPCLEPANARPPWIWFAAALAGCLWIFVHAVTRGTYAMFGADDFGDFYDDQARSLLAGRLDVPRKGIGGEAFVFEGRSYGYFGLTPAILRLPLAAVHIGGGMPARSFMVAYFTMALVFAVLVLRICYRRLRGSGTEPPAWAVVLLTLNAGLGSTLLFLGSRAYTYHEAILCGAAFAIGSVYFSLCFLFAPGGRAWIPALIFGVLSLHARPTSGIFALLLLGLTAIWPLGKNRLGIAFLCALGAFSFNVVGYLKFRDLGGFPLKYHVQYTPERLARFGGKAFLLANIPYDFDQYVSGVTFSLKRHFPYFYSRNTFPAQYQKAKIDMVESTVGIPWAMPGLVALTLLGTAYILLRTPLLARAIGMLWMALVPTALILFSAVVVSQRYTGDFCPFLICASSAGLAAIAAQWNKGRSAAVAGLWILAAAAILSTTAIRLQFQGTRGLGVTDEEMQSYQTLRKRMDNLLGRGP